MITGSPVPVGPDVVVGVLIGGATVLLAAAKSATRLERLRVVVLRAVPGEPPGRSAAIRPRLRLTGQARRWALVGMSALAGAFIGYRLAGPVGCAMGAVLAAAGPEAVRRRAGRRRTEALERQLAELVEGTALAVRTGLSLPRALEFAGKEAGPPLAIMLEQIRAEQSLGTSFEGAVHHLGEELATDDARLFALVVGVHVRTGGNLAVALDEVASTIRHRLGVRRELRALSAQGRISGAVLGALPVAFFFVLAATSHRELAPVYRSVPGVAMIAGGLLMQALAYVWIRRLMRVEI
jgi:tight adherence protein B